MTAAADMWAWAVTIAFAGTGELPFRGESLTATAYAILHAEPTVGQACRTTGLHRPSLSQQEPRLQAVGPRRAQPTGGRRSTARGPAPAGSPRSRSTRMHPARPRLPWCLSHSTAVTMARSALARSRRTGGAARRWPRRGAGGQSPFWARYCWLPRLGAAFALPATAHHQRGRRAPAQPQPPNPEAVARTQAITWVMHQVSRGAVVGCDAQVCTDLHSKGFRTRTC